MTGQPHTETIGRLRKAANSVMDDTNELVTRQLDRAKKATEEASKGNYRTRHVTSDFVTSWFDWFDYSSRVAGAYFSAIGILADEDTSTDGDTSTKAV